MDIDYREWIAILLPVGFIFRTGMHIYTAGALGRDPHLDPETDVTLASPVPSLREDGAHMVARLVCAALAAVLAWGFYPHQGGPVVLWLTLNWLILALDPVVGLVLLARQRRAPTATKVIQ